MDGFKTAVANALILYADMTGITPQEAGALFAENDDCREAVCLLVAMQAKGSPFHDAVIAQ